MSHPGGQRIVACQVRALGTSPELTAKSRRSGLNVHIGSGLRRRPCSVVAACRVLASKADSSSGQEPSRRGDGDVRRGRLAVSQRTHQQRLTTHVGTGQRSDRKRSTTLRRRRKRCKHGTPTSLRRKGSRLPRKLTLRLPRPAWIVRKYRSPRSKSESPGDPALRRPAGGASSAPPGSPVVPAWARTVRTVNRPSTERPRASRGRGRSACSPCRDVPAAVVRCFRRPEFRLRVAGRLASSHTVGKYFGVTPTMPLSSAHSCATLVAGLDRCRRPRVSADLVWRAGTRFASVVGVEVFDEAGAEAAQRCRPAFGEAVGVAGVGEHVIDGVGRGGGARRRRPVRQSAP